MNTLQHTYLICLHGQPHDSRTSQKEAEMRCQELRDLSWGTAIQIYSGIDDREMWNQQWVVTETS